MHAVKTALVCLLLASVSDAVVERQLIKYGGSAKRLRGTVTDWTGAPIPEVQVEVYDNPEVWDSTLSLVEMRSKQKKIGSTMTDDKGRYTIKGVPTGQYEVQFSRMGWNILSVLVNVDDEKTENLCVELQLSGGTRQGQVKKNCETPPKAETIRGGIVAYSNVKGVFNRRKCIVGHDR